MKKVILTISVIVCLTITATTAFASSEFAINKNEILKNAPTLNPVALNDAIKGYRFAVRENQISKYNTLTIIDFSKPSYDKRVWVINLKSDKLLMKLYTAQGKGSGLVYARHFSNKPGSYETSLGVYETLNPYVGKHGLSLRIKGLERGINNNTFRRDIVIHPAWYVTSKFIEKFHRAGRSWGCFALNPEKSRKFINLTSGGSILFAYATQEKNDPYLTGTKLI